MNVQLTCVTLHGLSAVFLFGVSCLLCLDTDSLCVVAPLLSYYILGV